MKALARLLAYRSKDADLPLVHQIEGKRFEDYNSPAKMLERGVPEVLREVDEQVRAEAEQEPPEEPRNQRRKNDRRTDWTKFAPRWALVVSVGLLGATAVGIGSNARQRSSKASYFPVPVRFI